MVYIYLFGQVLFKYMPEASFVIAKICCHEPSSGHRSRIYYCLLMDHKFPKCAHTYIQTYTSLIDDVLCLVCCFICCSCNDDQILEMEGVLGFDEPRSMGESAMHSNAKKLIPAVIEISHLKKPPVAVVSFRMLFCLRVIGSSNQKRSVGDQCHRRRLRPHPKPFWFK